MMWIGSNLPRRNRTERTTEERALRTESSLLFICFISHIYSLSSLVIMIGKYYTVCYVTYFFSFFYLAKKSGWNIIRLTSILYHPFGEERGHTVWPCPRVPWTFWYRGLVGKIRPPSELLIIYNLITQTKYDQVRKKKKEYSTKKLTWSEGRSRRPAGSVLSILPHVIAASIIVSGWTVGRVSTALLYLAVRPRHTPCTPLAEIKGFFFFCWPWWIAKRNQIPLYRADASQTEAPVSFARCRSTILTIY